MSAMSARSTPERQPFEVPSAAGGLSVTTTGPAPLTLVQRDAGGAGSVAVAGAGHLPVAGKRSDAGDAAHACRRRPDEQQGERERRDEGQAEPQSVCHRTPLPGVGRPRSYPFPRPVTTVEGPCSPHWNRPFTAKESDGRRLRRGRTRRPPGALAGDP